MYRPFEGCATNSDPPGFLRTSFHSVRVPVRDAASDKNEKERLTVKDYL
jgi:hypothetical protein